MARGYRRRIAKRLTRSQRNDIGNNQTQTLVSYMKQHDLFARGQVPRLGPQGHVKYQEMWSALAISLNEMGPSVRDVKAWQRYWTQLRLNAKSQKAKFLSELNRTGHNAPEQTLSDIDERISNIFGTYGTGINIGLELGLQIIPNYPTTEDLPDIMALLTEATVNALNSCGINLPRIDGILSRLQDNLRSILQTR